MTRITIGATVRAILNFSSIIGADLRHRLPAKRWFDAAGNCSRQDVLFPQSSLSPAGRQGPDGRPCISPARQLRSASASLALA